MRRQQSHPRSRMRSANTRRHDPLPNRSCAYSIGGRKCDQQWLFTQSCSRWASRGVFPDKPPVSYPGATNAPLTDLNTLIPSDSPYYLISATGINDAGEVVGMAVDQGSGETHAYLATPVNGAGASSMERSSISFWRMPERARLYGNVPIRYRLTRLQPTYDHRPSSRAPSHGASSGRGHKSGAISEVAIHTQTLCAHAAVNGWAERS